MSDVFDPLETRKKLESALGGIPESRRAAREAIVDNTNKINEVNDRYSGLMDLEWGRYEQSFENVEEIQNAITAIQRNPISSAFKGLVDEEFSIPFQKARLKEEQAMMLELQATSSRHAQSRAVQIQTAQQEMAGATTLYAFDRDLFLDTARMAEIGFQINDRVHQSIVRATQNVTQEKLQKWIDGDTKGMPKELLGLSEETRSGLFEISMLEKRGKAAGISMSEASTAIQESTAATTRRADVLRGVSTDSLQAMDEGTMSLPDFILPEDATRELQRRDAQVTSLETAKLSLAAGNVAFADKVRGDYLLRATDAELTAQVEAVAKSPSGRIMIENVEFTQTELQSAAATRTEVARKTKATRDARIIEKAGAQTGRVESKIGMQAILQEQGTNTKNMEFEDMINALPPDLQKRVAPIFYKQSVAEGIGSAEQLAKAADEMATVIQGYQDDLIERTAEPLRGAKEEFMTSGGFVRDIGNTTSALTELGGNKHLLAGSPIYGPAFNQFSTEFQKLRGSRVATTTLPGTSGVEGGGVFQQQTVTKLPDKAAVTQAIDTSDAAILAQDSLMEKVLIQALGELQMDYNEGPNQTGVGDAMFGGLANTRAGRLNDGLYDIDETGNRAINYFKISDALAAKTFTLRQDGTMTETTSIHDIVTTRMRQLVPQYENGSGSFEEAVFQNMLFPMNGFRDASNLSIAELSIKEAQSLGTVVQQQGVMREAAADLIKLEETAQSYAETVGGKPEVYIKAATQRTAKTVEGEGTFERLINTILGVKK